MQNKILIIDHHIMVAEAIAAKLIGDEVTIASSKAAAHQALAGRAFDFVLVDMQLSQEESGLSLIKFILSRKAKPIMIAGAMNVGLVRASIRLGAYGFINKEQPLAHLHAVLNDVLAEKFSFPNGVLDELRQNMSLKIPHLSKSERRLLDYFILHRNQTNFEIAEKMCLSEGRIRNCMTTLLRKFDVKRRSDLATEAELRGYFPDDF